MLLPPWKDGAPEVCESRLIRTIAGINNFECGAMVIEQLKQQLSGKEVGKMEYRGEMREYRHKRCRISR